MLLRSYTYFFILALFCFFKLSSIESYRVCFEGNLSPQLKKLLESASDTVKLQDSPPATVAGLKHRAEADVKNFLKVLHSQALYNATVNLDYQLNTCPAIVLVKVNPGPVYPLTGFYIVPSNDSLCRNFNYSSISLTDLKVNLYCPATPKMIVEAEENLLFLMAKQGYPLATIKDRDVTADQNQQGIIVTLHVDSGPQAYFGETAFKGLCSVKEIYVIKKLAWCQGAIYDPCKVQRTYSALEAIGLFSSINITYAQELNDCQQLPMQIEVIEGKQRSIGAGLAYSTDWGPGASFEWEHRNIGGMGEKLSFDLGVWQALQKANLRYIKPDFLKPNQDLVWIAQALHDKTKGYHETSFSISGLLEKQLSSRVRISYGGMYKILNDTDSVPNGSFNLLKAPFYLRYSNVNNILDPTIGTTVHLRVIPSWQFIKKQFVYCINTMNSTFYYPLTCDHQYVLAGQFRFGTILGSNRRTLPASERFYEGSDNSMRGFRFLTVSPLNHKHKPIGGRSLMTYSLELRGRATKNWGWVAFYDFGNVYSSILPNFNRRLLQSVGAGIRYHTPVGPLRLDVAVPLTPRSHVDHKFQVYLSIGQAF